MRIAFTHNLRLQNSEEEAEFDTPETVAAICGALTNLGHRVEPIEVSGPASRIVSRLESSNPDLIFNTAEGSHGRFREAFYPSLFEQLGIPYTGSDPYVCMLTLDKAMTKMVLERHGIKTPKWHYIDQVNRLKKCELKFPIIVKPNFEGSSKGIYQDSIVENGDQLRQKVEALLRQYPNGVLLEEFIVGKDLVVPFLEKAQSDEGGLLPPCEYVFDAHIVGERRFEVYDYDLKNQRSYAVGVELATNLEPSARRDLLATSNKIYRALGIRDLGRIDFRVSEKNEFYFLEVNALPSLEPGAGIYKSAEQIGLNTMESVLDVIIESAAARFKIKKTFKKKLMPVTIGITYNLKRIYPGQDGANDVEAEFDAESTVSALANTISSFGYKVVKLEATSELPTYLSSSGVDLVFNVAEGIKGRNRESQVPALLELVDMEYTGSDAATMSITLDKLMAKKIVRHAGILTPDFFQIVSGSEKIPSDIKYPLIIKPAAEGSSKGVFQSSVVFDESNLRKIAQTFREKYNQPVLVEEYIKGREFTVGLLGKRKPRILPPMEIVFLNPQVEHPVYSFQHKLQASEDVRYDTTADISPSLKATIERTARHCFQVLGCRDVARIDFRLDQNGKLYFLECNPIPGLTPDWSDLCLMAKAAGMDYSTLIREILSPALKRFKDKQRHISGQQ